MSRLFEKIEIPEIDLSETEKAIKNIWAEIDRIAKDIQEQKNNAMAMEFTKCIGELLRKNGVLPKMTEYIRDFETDNTFETRYGVSIDELDFSEHDKVFKDKIAELKKDFKAASGLLSDYRQENESLKQRISELESKETSDLPFDPLETANYLINETWERETSSLERGILKCPKYVSNNKYGIDELEQIAEHLLIYCKHNKDFEDDGRRF